MQDTHAEEIIYLLKQMNSKLDKLVFQTTNKSAIPQASDYKKRPGAPSWPSPLKEDFKPPHDIEKLISQAKDKAMRKVRPLVPAQTEDTVIGE